MSTRDSAIRELIREIVALKTRIADMERRVDNTIRHGKVTDVDPKKQRARIEIGERDGTPVKSAWVPYAQFAGPDGENGKGKGLKHHSPPFVGQQLTMFAPNGEVRQAVLLPFTWHEKAKSPSDKGDEHVVAWDKMRVTRKADSHVVMVGDAKITWKDGGLDIEVGKSKLRLTRKKISAKADEIETDGKTVLDKATKRVVTVAGPAARVFARV
ncbi:phage baseplate assembly protein V [Rhodoplanes sp. SY1]|uniref:phage baseplate assembly protein V n=1 Tax=Rhodoplanes sp. SY1 TaxID=3166646 RepID=UPI0038B44108